MILGELTTTAFSICVAAKIFEKSIHGECSIHYGNGQTWERCFFFTNQLHGTFKIYDQQGRLEQLYFFYHGKRIKRKYSVWLPEKPPRKPYKSTRSRFHTLEIL